MAVNFKDPKVIALGVGGLVLVWFFFLRKPGAASVSQQPSSNLPATTNPQQPTNSNAPSDTLASSGDILDLLGGVVDSMVNSQAILAGFAATTNQQFAGIAQSANAGLVDIATQVINHPPTITTIYYPVGGGGGGGGSTSAAGGPSPAPNVPTGSTFVPAFGSNPGTGTGASPQPAPPSYYSVSAGAPPQMVRHGAGLGGPQA